MPGKPRYMTTQEVADELQLNKRTVENWRYLPTPYGPPHTRIRGEVRYPTKAFEDWCEAQDSQSIN